LAKASNQFVPEAFQQALSRPVTLRVLVALIDQERFVERTSERSSSALFTELNAFYGRIETAVEGAGGMVVKFMGDAALVVFPEELAEDAIMALLQMKRDLDVWLAGQHVDSPAHVAVHFGEVTMGKMGAIDGLDVIGEPVNTCALLPHLGFSLTRRAFRCLSPASRRLFPTAEPPTTYHPTE